MAVLSPGTNLNRWTFGPTAGVGVLVTTKGVDVT